jgi:intein/homing endonuclease
MEFDLSEIEMSRTDKKLNIRIPRYLNSDLAYLMGIQIGDGYLKKTLRTNLHSTGYTISYDGHHINDKEWYDFVLKNLIKQLFNKDTNAWITTRGTVRINFRSKAIFTFLNKICRISQSPKTNIHIPDIIFSADDGVKRAFLRGLADTDFSLTFKKGQKPLITL